MASSVAMRLAALFVLVTLGTVGMVLARTDGSSALMFSFFGTPALAAAMVRLGEDGALRERLRNAARSRAEEIFSVEDVVHDTFLVYEELLGA